MHCYMCYKVIEDGEVEQLKHYQSQCVMYKSNQCSTLPSEGSVGDKAMKASMSLFPQFLKGKLPALCGCLLVLGLIVPIWVLNSAEEVTSLGSYINSYTSECLFLSMSNRELIQYHNLRGNLRSSDAIIDRAETVPAEHLFAQASENPDLLIRVHGYITSMRTDFLFGSYMTVGNQRNFLPTDIHIPFDVTPARVGDEVIMFLIPVFSGFDTPLWSWEWTQIRAQ